MSLSIVSLFTGIGGIEHGMAQAGHSTKFMCEILEPAKNILQKNYPDIELLSDVTQIDSLPHSDIITAGFPCQDLSQAGMKKGINGNKSNVVFHLFRLLDSLGSRKPEWLLVENVPYMLRLDRGGAMNSLVKMLEQRGYKWAYRVVDARSFGTPQRRPRVLMLASLNHSPENYLYSDESDQPVVDPRPSAPVADSAYYGFYWTEGSRGVGWAKEAVPPIKGGSGIGIPSPPAVWVPSDDYFGTIDIRDAERMQGFSTNWTEFTDKKIRPSLRWKLVGNAVNTNVAKWIGEKLNQEENQLKLKGDDNFKSWPKAAFGAGGKAFKVDVSPFPVHTSSQSLSSFLEHPLKDLSHRATSGFYKRTQTCTNVVYSEQFLESLTKHIDRMSVDA